MWRQNAVNGLILVCQECVKQQTPDLLLSSVCTESIDTVYLTMDGPQIVFDATWSFVQCNCSSSAFTKHKA